jgi:hypothetical protein
MEFLNGICRQTATATSDDPAPVVFLPHVDKTFNCTCLTLTRNNAKLVGLPLRTFPVKDDHGIPCECDRLYKYIGLEVALAVVMNSFIFGI